jgi:hypothetical protein
MAKTQSKGKSMKDTSVYAGIVKMDDNGDGTLTVYGKATDDSIDIDQQICDPAWLDRAMPEWFMSGGNIREQHSNIAAGVAQEYEQKKDGHYISALVVDPVSVKKVKARVLKGFSIGIKAPRVVRDQKAANGRIIDGQIVEVSLVDRPANPNCQLVLAKSVNGEKTLVKTEELIEKHGDHDQADHGNRGGGSSESERGERDNSVPRGEAAEAREAVDRIGDLRDELINANGGRDTAESRAAQRAMDHLENANESLQYAADVDNDDEHDLRIDEARESLQAAASQLDLIDSNEADDITDRIADMDASLEDYYDSLTGGSDKSSSTKSQNKERLMARRSKAAKSAGAKEADGMPMNGEAKSIPSREEMLERYAGARKALDEVTRMCKEYGYGDIEKQYGESAEEETAEGSYPNAAEEEVAEARGEKPLDKEVVVEDNSMADKSVQNDEENVQKCLECGCNQPANSHGNPNVSTAVMVSPDQTPVPTPAIQPPTPKSVTTIVPPSTIEEIGTITEDSDEEDSAEKSLLADSINVVIEKAVKSAMASVSEEIAALKSAKEAVESKAASLETELATAKSLAIGGGPKRTTIATGAKTNNEWKAKADLYLAKASATTDNELAKGYREMAKEYLAKSTSEAQA